MSFNLSIEQILALAPDDKSARDGKGLALPARWERPGSNEQALWGECYGSGKKPYQTRVDLHDMAFKCSCPSRKLPCKHVLGLLIMRHEHPAAFVEAEPPPWVAEWLDSRTQSNQKRKAKQAAPQKKADPAAQEKRARERHTRTADGLAELERWLHDLVRRGLSNARGEPPTFWENIAARMVDAQAPGAGRMLRDMAAIARMGQGWEEPMLDYIGRLYLLIEGFKRLGVLPADTQADIAIALGWTQHQDEVLATGTGIRDTWLVLAQRVEEREEDRLLAQYTWLWGSENARPALVLDFAFVKDPLDKSLLPGTRLDAELVFYPGAAPLRALVKQRHAPPAPLEHVPGAPTIAAATDAYSAALERCPWIERYPFVLQAVVPVYDDGQCLLYDNEGRTLPCAPAFANVWHLLALSGGHPLALAGEWDGYTLLPLSVWAEGRFKTLHDTERGVQPA